VIENVQQSRGPAFRFTISGVFTTADSEELTTQLDQMIGDNKKPIGVLADLSQMDGADWIPRWGEMRFLERHTNQIARLAIVGASEWEEIASMVLVASAVLQAQTLYFLPSELSHAWHWVKMVKHDDEMPVRMMYQGHGLFENYTPEYMGV
jgi:hypothetical protein